MNRKTQHFVDTGPLVAFLNRKDRYHEWAKQILQDIKPPLITCQPVITEACFILRKVHNGRDHLLELLNRKLLKTDFQLNKESDALKKLITKYQNIPMSLADACLVRLAELNQHGELITLDQDFTLYRKHGRFVIPTLMPQ